MSAPADSGRNPLLEPFDLPYGAPPLARIKPEHYLPAFEEALKEARAQLDDIKNNRAAPTFENTIEALQLSGKHMSRIATIFGNVKSAAATDELRAIEKTIETESVKLANEELLDAGLFARVKAVYDQRASLSLTGEQARLLERTYRGFAEEGAALDPAGKTELASINEKLAKLYTDFENNCTKGEDTYARVVEDENELKGLPARVKAMYREFAKEANKPDAWVIKLSPPPTDLLAYCENRSLREEVYRAQFDMTSKPPYDNSQNVLDIVALRHRKAELLGYDNFAAYTLSDRMAKKPETVMEFLEANKSAYKPAAQEYLDKVKAYALKTDGVADVQPWDVGYYGRRLKEETFKLTLEDVRPYFDLEKVLDGLRKHAEKLFNIELTETKDKYEVYAPGVKVYEVKDKASGEMLGIFYADYYARSGAKNGGAWMNTLRKRGLDDDGENKFSLVANCCNFPKPTPEHPTLLSIDDVRTVFHEFGHGLHALLAKGTYTSLTCTSVLRDFVELPSQLQENWVMEKEVLDTFAAHHITGAPIPAEMVQKIQDMDNFDAGYRGLRQTFFGLLDMKWHTTDPKTIKSVAEIEDAVVADASLFPRMAAPISLCMGHLFAGEGYSAGYYGYKYAESMDADVFSVFKKVGLYHRETADRLRRTIYEKGNTEEPDKLYRDMMGRDPDPDAMFLREGLEPPKKPPATPPAPANSNEPAKPAPKRVNK
jgi:peptidyl-dipeptidase Dcp